MKHFPGLSHSIKKYILRNENTNTYSPKFTCYYIINKEKKTRIRITNQKYASFLHRLLDEDVQPLKNSQNIVLKTSQNYSRNRQSNISISRTKNSTDISTPHKKESKIKNLKVKISPKKSASKQKIKVIISSNKNIKHPENNKFDYIKQEKHLQKLYGNDKTFSKIKNLIKRRKSLDLKKYQDNIIKISGNHLSKNSMKRFISELNGIRKSAEMIKPLPPINFPLLIIHSLKENENKEKKQIENKRYAEMGEYQKEINKIKRSSIKDKVLFRRNENNELFKSYNCVPEYIINALTKSKNKV